MVKAIPQGYGKCKSDNDRHQSNYPRVFPRDITTGDGAQAETQPHIFEELPGPCGSIRQEHGGPPCLERWALGMPFLLRKDLMCGLAQCADSISQEKGRIIFSAVCTRNEARRRILKHAML